MGKNNNYNEVNEIKDNFDENWKKREETNYNHWTKGQPKNQIQLAFRRHWILFQELLGSKKTGKCLEIGCGRGTISNYFADNGYDCTLADISFSVLKVAKQIFATSHYNAKFSCCDVNYLPFHDNSFDVIVSIGLLEHFQNVKNVLKEQIRVLKDGGTIFCYVVPENKNNVQKYYNCINTVLKLISIIFKKKKKVLQKEDVFRSVNGSAHYLQALEGEPIQDVKVMGMYPLPMISHSVEFPFTLLPPFFERILTAIFKVSLFLMSSKKNKNPWVCDEQFGQAFLLTFKKDSTV